MPLCVPVSPLTPLFSPPAAVSVGGTVLQGDIHKRRAWLPEPHVHPTEYGVTAALVLRLLLITNNSIMPFQAIIFLLEVLMHFFVLIAVILDLAGCELS